MAVLLVTNKEDVTTDFIIKKLQENGISYYRFNTEDLFKYVSFSFDFATERFWLHDSIKEASYPVHEFTAVYYRRPVIPEYDIKELSYGERKFLKVEAFYTLEGFYKILSDKIWVSPVFSIREAENKFYQLRLAKQVGFKIPPTIATNIPNELYKFTSSYQSCIIKPVHCGRILDFETPKIVYTSELGASINESAISCSTAYVQEKINKKYDIRVTLVGNKIFATAIYSQDLDETKIDWRKGEHILRHERIELPNDIISKCQKLLSLLNLKYGAIDLIRTESDEFYFLEINPNGQWVWIERLTGYDISGSIVELLCKYEN